MLSSCIEQLLAPITGHDHIVTISSSEGNYELPVSKEQLDPFINYFKKNKNSQGIYVMGRNIIIISHDQEKMYFDALGPGGSTFMIQYNYDIEIYSKLKNKFPSDTINVEWLNWSYE
jgi:hypothetical protein